jgi:hypothetical protein
MIIACRISMSVIRAIAALVRIADGVIIEGRLPPAVARIVREWTQLRCAALMRNWEAARRDAPLERISGLDDD